MREEMLDGVVMFEFVIPCSWTRKSSGRTLLVRVSDSLKVHL